jgi:hypothetical protein
MAFLRVWILKVHKGKLIVMINAVWLMGLGLQQFFGDG